MRGRPTTDTTRNRRTAPDGRDPEVLGPIAETGQEEACWHKAQEESQEAEANPLRRVGGEVCGSQASRDPVSGEVYGSWTSRDQEEETAEEDQASGVGLVKEGSEPASARLERQWVQLRQQGHFGPCRVLSAGGPQGPARDGRDRGDRVGSLPGSDRRGRRGVGFLHRDGVLDSSICNRRAGVLVGLQEGRKRDDAHGSWKRDPALGSV